MSLTSYRAAPPRVMVIWQKGGVFAGVMPGILPVFVNEKILLRLADLAVTYSPAS